jgi:membrane protein implicated in regulation of membrane protease activity
MGLWVLWVVVAGAFAAGEVHTNGFYLAPFALGAVLAAVLSLVGVSGGISAVGFLAGSLAIILLLRPLALRHRSASTRSSWSGLPTMRALAL